LCDSATAYLNNLLNDNTVPNDINECINILDEVQFAIMEDINYSKFYHFDKWEDIKAIITYMIKGIKTETTNDQVNWFYIVIYVESLYLNTIDGLQYINSCIYKLTLDIRRNIMSLITNTIYNRYIKVDSKHRNIILSYLRKYVIEGNSYTMMRYNDIKYKPEVLLDDIISYINNYGDAIKIPYYLIQKYNITHSPEIFELVVNKGLQYINPEYSYLNETDIDMYESNSMLVNHSIVYFLYHDSKTELPFESKLLINKYVDKTVPKFTLVSYYECYDPTKWKLNDSNNDITGFSIDPNLDKGYCQLCKNSNYYADECNNYYNQLPSTIDNILLLDKLTISIITSYLAR
jgi:hypothetical protein